jgi:hypothetical protein
MYALSTKKLLLNERRFCILTAAKSNFEKPSVVGQVLAAAK